MDRALPELNQLTWEPQEEYGVPYPMSSKEIGSMPAHHLFKASMTAQGVLCRVWIHTTRNIDLDSRGKLILTGKGRHKILHLSLSSSTARNSARATASAPIGRRENRRSTRLFSLGHRNVGHGG